MNSSNVDGPLDLAFLPCAVACGYHRQLPSDRIKMVDTVINEPNGSVLLRATMDDRPGREWLRPLITRTTNVSDGPAADIVDLEGPLQEGLSYMKLDVIAPLICFCNILGILPKGSIIRDVLARYEAAELILFGRESPADIDTQFSGKFVVAYTEPLGRLNGDFRLTETVLLGLDDEQPQFRFDTPTKVIRTAITGDGHGKSCRSDSSSPGRLNWWEQLSAKENLIVEGF